MKTSEHQHFIFVRPPGSHTWTLHMNPATDKHYATPWRDGRAEAANIEACRIVEHSNYCAIVVPIKLPQEKDAQLYALFADGDTMFSPVEPLLKSKEAGIAK